MKEAKKRNNQIDIRSRHAEMAWGAAKHIKKRQKQFHQFAFATLSLEMKAPRRRRNFQLYPTYGTFV